MESFPELEGEAWGAAVQRALRSWRKSSPGRESPLDFLCLVRQLVDQSGLTPHQATKRILSECLEELESQDAQAAEVLHRRFVKGDTLAKVGFDTGLGEFAVSRVQAAAIDQLAACIAARERALRRTMARALESDLPPPSYEQLFGLDEAQNQLRSQILSPHEPWLIAITGIGGIGKTSLADRVTRQTLAACRFSRVFWLRMEPGGMGVARGTPKFTSEKLLADLGERLGLGVAERLTPAARESRIRSLLKECPTLVVIDNLEESEDINELLPKLRYLADPSKFILTTRSRPDGQTAVFSYTLGELSLADAVALVRYQARALGQMSLAAASAADIERIYTVTGGNPLALKLVVGLADRLSLTDVLDELARGQINKTDQMYHHIYERAWTALSPDAQTLLQAMPLVSRSTGGDLAQLQAISELPAEAALPAVDELVRRNLLESRGTIWERRYGIHRLTETFLNTVITGWLGDAS
ncbi:MAG: hypothetical protein Fur0021_12300 [Candidatus Promineifilaceae bacterium]